MHLFRVVAIPVPEDQLIVRGAAAPRVDDVRLVEHVGYGGQGAVISGAWSSVAARIDDYEARL